MNYPEMSAPSILSMFANCTQAQRDLFVQKVMEQVESGNLNPLYLKIMMKNLEDILANINEQVRDMAVEEAMKHGKEFEYIGAKVTVAEFGTKYHYDKTNFKPYKDAKKLVKDYEEYLRGLKEPIQWVDTETGEEVTIYPPLKTSTTSISIKLD